MKGNLELNKMGLYSLSNDELFFIDAGNRYRKLWNGVKWVVEKVGIFDFFSDMWEGAKEGYHEARHK